ncbi:type VI secretion system-associated protein TagO [Tabrizicola sp.]|uniref:type VI secretion system-associated protein TagO n=1 Tax=Tabrizicola sp. TaxID=2005166 RepID=UPI002734DA53|nr:type VI secretion system-associated protein TagO [Tabrizicola sp.]MDP3197647.1 type VI secretion system-associated protein TagO [Tabrizicola sp.]
MSVGKVAFGLSILCCVPVQAEVLLVCAFPTLPDAVIRYPDDPAAEKTMQVGARPAVTFQEGQGAGRILSANVDGYSFQIAPENSYMDVLREGATIQSEQGDCVTVGGPTNDQPLSLESGDQAQDAPVAEPTPSKGRWKTTEEKSAFDDSRTVVLSIESNETVRGQFGAPGPAFMYLRCMENTTSAYLWINELFLSDIQGYGVVDYRIDDRKASKLRAESSTDNKALGVWSGGKAIPFIKEMLGGGRIAFRATPFNESPVEFTFDLTGLDAAVAPLREACAW